MSEADNSDGLSRRGLIFILSSPSGAGKSTLARHLLATDPELEMSVSATTRPPRPGEVDGKDYHFITKDRFDKMRAAGEFLESATVFENGYGTPRQPVEDWLAKGRDVLFDIDWQGTQQVAGEMGKDVVRVFVLPPSAIELRDRLIGRAQDKATVVAKRMAEASSEISHWAEYDYVVINDDLDRCKGEVETILAAERLKRERQTGLHGFVRTMLEKL